MNRIGVWQEKVDALSLRERLAVFFCCLFVIYFAWDVLLMQPLTATRKQTSVQLEQKKAEHLALTTQLQTLGRTEAADLDKANREKLRLLRAELEQVEIQVKDSTRHLISPRKMAAMLESVLLKVKGLELIQVKGLGSEPVVKPGQQAVDAGREQQEADKPMAVGLVDNAYKHGLRIEFEGDYLGTLEYIRELENLEWGFFWESVNFEVKEYPTARVAISVFTLSLDKNWIGV